MTDYLRTKPLKRDDEAWLVLDRNHWPDEQLIELCNWADEENNRGIAISNPSFEYWLLLHFEDRNVSSARDCKRRLELYLPNYRKRIDDDNFSKEQIMEAVERSKTRDDPPWKHWPKDSGSTVYRIVEKLIH